MRKGIVLAGGRGTRLYPMTVAVSKQLIPVYDKPMIYYPLATLMRGGVRRILIISTPEDTPLYRKTLGTGAQWGLDLEYAVQERPDGLAQAFLIGRDFLDGDDCVLILGDNIFFGDEIAVHMRRAAESPSGATVFAYPVKDPRRYGVVVMDDQGRATRLVEKPDSHLSDLAITGLYFYDRRAVEYAESLEPSARGQLEITDLNSIYLGNGELEVVRLGRGTAWLDMGTPEALLEATQFIAAIERRQGVKVACLEEVAYRLGYVSADDLRRLGAAIGRSEYGSYLVDVANDPAGAPDAGEST